MPRRLALALLLLPVSGSALEPPNPIVAEAPFEVLAAGFDSPRGIAVDAEGAVYVADRGAGTVTRVEPGGARTVVAYDLDRPVGLTIDHLGRLLVAEQHGARVVRLDPAGLTVVAGGIVHPRWLAVSETGTLYVSARRPRPDATEPDDESAEPQTILAVTPQGALSVFADGFTRLGGLAAGPGALYVATAGLHGTSGREGVVYRIPVLPDGRAGALEPLAAGAFQRPIGLALDRLGALFVTARVAELDGLRHRRAIVKLHPDGVPVLFASGLDGPQGLAFDGQGHLYLADGRAGRVLRFAAPPAPVLAPLPRFTTQPVVALTGTTVPDARVDVVVTHDGPPVVTTSTGSGTFSVSLTPVANGEISVAVRATGAHGDGLTSLDTEVSVVHDTIPPAILFEAPGAGASVRGPVPVRASAADAGSGVAALDVSAPGHALGAAVVPPPPAPAVTATATWPTGEVPDGAHTLTATAVDGASNLDSVSRVVIVDNTPPDTAITDGPGGSTPSSTATFAFTGTDGLTPAASLLFAWRLDGGAWGAFAGATTVTLTDLAPGSHLFEVIGRDLAGNDDPTPAGRAFVIEPAGAALFAIGEPQAGAAVPAGSLIVRGAVEAGDSAVGVSVNGFPALVHGSHWAVEIPITPGVNTITALATTVTGVAATASVAVAADTAAPAVFLHAEPASGVAPLAVTWRVASRTPRPLVSFELDPAGTGAFGDPLGVLDGTQSTFAAGGLFVPTVRATDDEGTVHVVKTLVLVEEADEVAARFAALWASFKASLQAGDHAGALAHLSPALGARFQPILQQLGQDLSVVASTLGPIELVDVVGDLAEAALVQVEQGSPFLYFVYFRRDTRGRWLIQEM
jgi:sugar lactone lactonase YvrE